MHGILPRLRSAHLRHRLGALGAVGALSAALVTGLPSTASADPAMPSTVEDFSYPGAAAIEQEQGIKVIRGDGRITLTECGPTDVIIVETLDRGQICFRVRGTVGFLGVEIPSVYFIRGGDEEVTAKVTLDEATQEFEVDPGEWESVVTPEGDMSVLLELRAGDPDAAPPAGGAPVGDAPDPFTAKIRVGDVATGRGCSGALVAAQWVLTAKSCFAQGGQAVTYGPPPVATSVIVGRPDLTTTTGLATTAVRLIPHPDRDVVLVALARPATGVPVVPIATTAPASGDVLRIVGFGRTATEWVPDRAHATSASVTAVAAGTLDIVAAADPAAPTTCKGDAGGPALRVSGSTVQLVAIHHVSWQNGCLIETESRQGATETRVDDLAGWITANATRVYCNARGTANGASQSGLVVYLGDYTGGCAADIISQNSAGALRSWRSTGVVADSALFAGGFAAGSGWTTSAYPRVITGDFDGDGRTDIMNQNSAGELHAWSSTGNLGADNAVFVGAPRLVGTGFTTGSIPRLATGDVNGDGRTDLVGVLTDGSLRVWPSTGDLSADRRLFAAPARTVGTGWTSANYPRMVLGDFNGDDRTDIIGQDTAGQLRAWASTGDLSADHRLFTGPSRIVGTGWTATNIPRIVLGDFNGDHRTDIIGQDSTGQLRAWPSNGDLSADSRLFTGAARIVGTGWTVAAYPRIVVGDLNGDGRTDIIAQATDGRLRGWASTGNIANSGLFVGAAALVGTGWSISSVPRIL
jgi:hypothetical protein